MGCVSHVYVNYKDMLIRLQKYVDIVKNMVLLFLSEDSRGNGQSRELLQWGCQAHSESHTLMDLVLVSIINSSRSKVSIC